MGEKENPSDRTIAAKNHRFAVKEDTGDLIECSGESYRSCTAGLIADCVAVCCCPCAVVNILTLTFVKLPWMVGRKCLGLGKKNKKGQKKIGNSRSCSNNKKKKYDENEMDMDGISREEEGTSGIVMFTGFGEEEERDKNNNYSARFEAEKVWLELYQVGHFGFGRVSFTGQG